MSTPAPINKPLVGIIGMVCLISAAICYLFYPSQTSALSAFLRIGIVMSALFLALPKAGEHVRWGRFVPIMVGSIILIVVTRRMILFVLPLLLIVGIVLTLFRPRDKHRPPRTK